MYLKRISYFHYPLLKCLDLFVFCNFIYVTYSSQFWTLIVAQYQVQSPKEHLSKTSTLIPKELQNKMISYLFLSILEI